MSVSAAPRRVYRARDTSLIAQTGKIHRRARMTRLEFMLRTAAILLAVSTSLGIAEAQQERVRPSVRAVPLTEGEKVELDGRLK